MEQTQYEVDENSRHPGRTGWTRETPRIEDKYLISADC
jgi:hypothetical protein